MRSIALLAVGILCAFSHGQTQPQLVVDAGGHTALIDKVLFNRDGKSIVSVSLDKSIRIWDAATGVPIRTLRAPSGAGLVGALYAADLSADGKTLAVGSYLNIDGTFPIFLIDLAEGKVIRCLRGHGNSIRSLAFAPKGKRLCSGSADKTIRIWDYTSGECERTISGFEDEVMNVAFSPAGASVATADQAGKCRVWDLASGLQSIQLANEQGRWITRLAWSQDGQTIATNWGDNMIRIWDKQGKATGSVTGIPGFVRQLKFFDNDRQLLFGTDFHQFGLNIAGCINLNHPEFPIAKNPHYESVTSAKMRHTNSVRCVDSSPDGKWIVSAGGINNEAIVWNTNDSSLVSRLTAKGRSVWAVDCCPNMRQIGWGNSEDVGERSGSIPVQRVFDLEALEVSPASAGKLGGRRLALDGVELHYVGEKTVEFFKNDKSVSKLTFDSRVHSATMVTPSLAAVGTLYGHVHLVDVETGKVRRMYNGHSQHVRSLACSPDSKYIIAGSTDQVITIWGLDAVEKTVGLGVGIEIRDRKILVRNTVANGPVAEFLKAGDTIAEIDGEKLDAEKSLDRFMSLARGAAGTDVRLKVIRPKEDQPLEFKVQRKPIESPRNRPLLSLFFAGDEWIVWTPEGYYAASPGGEKLMGWHVNNGPDAFADFHPAAQFRNSFYRPDVIKLVIAKGGVQEALAAAETRLGKKIAQVNVTDVLPPKARITTPEGAIGVKSSTMEVKARADSTGSHPVTALHLMIDGRPLPLGRVRIENPKLGEATASWTITLSAGKQRLSVKADSAVSSTVSEEVDVTYQPPDPVETIKLPNLYVLAVGISEYPKELKLNYAHKDAQALAQTLQTHSKGLYEKIEVKELLNAQATQREVRKGISWLAKQMTQRDVGVLFLAGHGEIAANGAFYYLPADIDPEDVAATGVPGNEIKESLAAMPGKIIFMLDACHSGGFESNKKRNTRSLTDDLIRDLVADERGVIALCASTGRQFALESNEHRHGIFTLAIVEALQGKAAKVEGAVYLHHLDAYVTDRVKELSQGRQSPTTARPASVRSFPLTRP